MTTTSGLKGIQANAYAPYQSDPAAAPGTVQTGFLDPSNFVMTRGPVLTDEGAFREMFAVDPFTAPGTEWTQQLDGGSIVVAGGVCTMTAGLTANGRTFVAIPIDYLPLSFSFDFDEVAGRVTAANTPDFFFGMYSELDPDVAIASGEFIEESWLGSASNTQGRFRSGVGGFLQETLTHTITGRTTQGFRSLILDAEAAQIRDNTTTLPTTSVRATHSTKIPNLTTNLYLAFGFRNGPAPANPWSVQIRAIYVNNTNRLRVNTGF